MCRGQYGLFVCVMVCELVCQAVWAQPPAKSDAPSAKADVAAYVGGEAVTLQELDAKVLKTNMKLAQSLYDARRATLDQVILERSLGAEAAAKSVTVEEIIRQKIAEKAKPVTDEDVDAYYKANTARMGGRTLEQVSGQIRNMLASQQENQAREALLTELKDKAQVKVTLDAPRTTVAIAPNDPIRGPADAKVTIVEFSDFQ